MKRNNYFLFLVIPTLTIGILNNFFNLVSIPLLDLTDQRTWYANAPLVVISLKFSFYLLCRAIYAFFSLTSPVS